MRASRLLAILAALQSRGRVTAVELAMQCEVTPRTIYRDVEALSAAGIPVESVRGSDGGYRLMAGYVPRLSGLSGDEAELLVMLGMAGAARDLGLGPVMTSAQDKLLSALPLPLKPGAALMRQCFYFDAPGWFASGEEPEHLPLLAAALRGQLRLSMRYRSWKGERERTVAPLGLVLKSGAWYLVAQIEGNVRTYRVSRIVQMRILDETFVRPAFDLEAYWKDSTLRLSQAMYGKTAVLRLSPLGVKLLEVLSSSFVLAATVVEADADESGWRVARMPVGDLHQACVAILPLGAEAEVVAPEALRLQMAAIAARMALMYRASDTGAKIARPSGAPAG